MEQNGTTMILSDDIERMEPVHVKRLLAGTYWAAERSLDEIKRSMDASHCFAAFADDRMVAFARVVTDGVSVYWLCDVVVDPDFRGQGIGKAMLDFVLEDHSWKGLGILITEDAHALYQRYGYQRNRNEFMMKEQTGPQQ